jgi:hypothetical protein
VLKDSVIDDNDRRVADHAGLAREQRDAEQETFDQVRQELNLTQAEARQLHGLVTEMRVNGTTEGWRREAATWPRHMRAQLRERHGSDSEKVAADVASYIEARPVLQTFLGELQHHPDVVAILSERTRRPWRYGRQG